MTVMMTKTPVYLACRSWGEPLVLHGSVAVRESQEGTFLGSGFVLDGLRRDEEHSDPFWIGRCQRAGSPATGYLTVPQ